MILVFGIIPTIVALLCIGFSIASAAKQRTPLQIGAACLVVLLVAESEWALKQMLFNGAFALYLPFVFVAVSAVIAALQVWTVKLTKRRA